MNEITPMKTSCRNNQPIDSISERIQRTKADIGKLKAELQELIDYNKTGVATEVQSVQNTSKTQEQPIVLNPVPKSSLKISPVQEKIAQEPKEKKAAPVQPRDPSKSKETRLFMRKQKEQRATEIKTQITATDNQVDLKKQRLKELHQRTLELLAKNVQMKREQSKSRDRNDVIRLDKTKDKTGNNTGNKTGSKPGMESGNRARSREPKSTCSKVHPYPESDLSKITFRGQVQDRIGAFERMPASRNQQLRAKTKSQPNLERLEKLAEPKSPRGRSQERRDVAIVSPGAKVAGSDKVAPKSQPSLVKVNGATISKSNKAVVQNQELQSKSSGESNLQSKVISEVPPQVKTKSQETQFEPVSLKVTGLNGTVTELAEFAPPNPPKLLKETKETQTRKLMKLREPPWLQQSSTNPDHYNFINTVKRKIQYTVQTPKRSADAAVQNTPFTPSHESVDSIRKILREEVQKTPQSFVSHQNLDLKAVDDLELICSHKITESDSDTSKNIPDISSESIEFKLNLEPVKTLKLDVHKTDNFIDGPSYTSDFNTASKASNKRSLNDTFISLNMPSLNLFKKSPTGTKRTVSRETSLKSPQISFNTQASVESDKKVNTPNSQKTSESIKTSFSNSYEREKSFVVMNNQSSSPTSAKSSDTGKSSESSKTVKSSGKPSESIKTSLSVDTNNTKQKSPTSLKEASFIVDTVEKTSSVKGSQVDQTEEKVPDLPKNTQNVPETTESHMFLKPPAISLSTNKRNKNSVSSEQFKNITIRQKSTSKDNVNEIHLKFEAEVHLLNDCHEYFQQFNRLEQAYKSMTNSNHNLFPTKVQQNENTQTSKVSEERPSTINYSRGSDTITRFLDFSHSDSIDSVSKTLVQVDESAAKDRNEVSLFSDNYLSDNLNNCTGVSLNVFEHLIRDEDSRIKHLKTIIKIRQQSLLDRTKTELRWLEIQRKQLIETGKVDEASLIKKKQRGILLKHEQERNEIKRLKQMQQEESQQRKHSLRHQKQLIKSQLCCTGKMLSKIKCASTPRTERRSCAPLRVVQSCSETSISRRNSEGGGEEEVVSIKSQSITFSEEFDSSCSAQSTSVKGATVTDVKRTLYLREAALQKRRHIAEQLLQWHRKLLDEEKKIQELEATATSVVHRKHHDVNTTSTNPTKRQLSGRELNKLWHEIAGTEDGRFADNRTYTISQEALERFFKSAKQHARRNKRETSESDTNYSSVFEPESKISSISELIENFSKIETNISALSRKSETIITDQLEMPSQVSESKSVLKSLGKAEEPHEERKDNSVHITAQSQSIVTEPQSIDLSAKVSNEIDEQKSKDTSEEIEEVSEDLEIASNISSKESRASAKGIKDTSSRSSSETDDKEETDVKTSISRLSEEEIEENTEITTKLSEENAPKTTTRSIDLVEALSSAANIEESLSKINAKLSNTSSEISEELHLEGVVSPLASQLIPLDLAKEKTEDTFESEVESSVSEAVTSVPKTSFTVSEQTKPEEVSNEVNTSKSESENDIAEEEQSVQSSKSDERSEDVSVSQLQLDEKTMSEKTPSTKSPNEEDVKEKVDEIPTEVSQSVTEEKTAMQESYVTTYDINTTSSESPNDEDKRIYPPSISLGNEAEELLRQQLAIEQEIKQLEQQQRGQLPYIFMREIPNKPPPPYTPPAGLPTSPPSLLPQDVKGINEITNYSSKILFKAFQNRNLANVKYSEKSFRLYSKLDLANICAEFMFNICRDLACDHYKQFEPVQEPLWLTFTKHPQLIKPKPLDAVALEKYMNRKLREMFGFRRAQVAENAIIKWSRKKRDHVDEILVIESQEEEAQWTNFEKEELIIKDEITNYIMSMLLRDTADVFSKIIAKRNHVV